MERSRYILVSLAVLIIVSLFSPVSYSQNYNSVIDKTIAVIGNEMISLSQLEQEIKYMQMNTDDYDADLRCKLLEQNLDAKLLLMQARLDSLKINNEYVDQMLKARIDQLRQALGGDAAVLKKFGKPVYKIKEDWRRDLENQSLTQQMQSQIVSGIAKVTPEMVRHYLDTVNVNKLPIVPTKYGLAQICVYPDREKADLAVKQELLKLRERILKGTSFSLLARLYSEDPGSAARGGELGMAPKSSFWPAFSNAAMSLKPGAVSQIVQTPDGFHLIQVIKKDGDMFDARHILLRPKYTEEDKKIAFARLDSIRNIIISKKLDFSKVAQLYSQDPKTAVDGGRIDDPQTGAFLTEISHITPPSDYQAIKSLKVGQISKPVVSLDREGRSGNRVYKIIKVVKIVPAHRADIQQDYALLENILKQKLAEQAMNKFINNKIAHTNIYIDPMFKKCKFKRPAWNKLIQSEK